MKQVLKNYSDCIKFIKSLVGKDKVFVNTKVNNLDVASKVKLLSFVTGVKIVERENAEKSI
jgi:hypothetical protein